MNKSLSKIIIAIDGHSSCGKSTVAKDIADKFGLRYIDTGAMYRAFTLFALSNNLVDYQGVNEEALESRMNEVNIELKMNSEGKVETYLNGENVEEAIRSLEVSDHVSLISTLSFVRKKLVLLQQEMGREGGLVMDGRDIGSVVFPNADLKIFMTASPEIRAQRRYNEMIKKGEKVNYEDVLANVIKRDHIDSTRKESPLLQSDDAWLLDNSFLNQEEQLNLIVQKLKEMNWLKSNT